NLYTVGTLARIIAVSSVDENLLEVVALGLERAVRVRVRDHDDTFFASFQVLSTRTEQEELTKPLINRLRKLIEPRVRTMSGMSKNTIRSAIVSLDPSRIADACASLLPNLTTAERQDLLETKSTRDRLQKLVDLLEALSGK